MGRKVEEHQEMNSKTESSGSHGHRDETGAGVGEQKCDWTKNWLGHGKEDKSEIKAIRRQLQTWEDTTPDGVDGLVQKVGSALDRSHRWETDGFYIPGQSNGVGICWLVDTGAMVSLISEKTFHRLTELGSAKLETSSATQLEGAGGAAIRMLGTVELDVNMGPVHSTHQFVVAAIDVEGILGLDFLMKHAYKVNGEAGQMVLNGQTIQGWYGHTEGASFRVKVSEKIEIPPLCQMMVPTKMQRTGKITEYGIVEPEMKLQEKKAIMVARCVISTNVDDISLRVVNCSEEPVMLRKDETIAWCSSVQKIYGTQISESSVSEGELCPALQDLIERSSEHLTEDGKKQLTKLIREFSDVFAHSSDDYGQTSLVEHEIDTGLAAPVKQAPRRIPLAKQEIAAEEIKKMLKAGVIEPSTSPWASPVVLATKKDGGTRFCLDYRRLNQLTRKDAYPLPRVEDCFDSLGGAKWFATMDLCSGYWQVKMAEKDKEKTAFVTREGLYQFNVMPFGLSNGPATFERLMEVVLRGLQWKDCLVFLDDIITFGRTKEELWERLRKVLGKLRVAGLKLKPKKCHFMKKEVEFLGHVVSESGIRTNEEKIKKVRDCEIPNNVSELRAFLGLCSYYRRFIKDFAKIARPLHQLTSNNVQYKWTEECTEAFESLKQALTSTPILAYPTQSGKFILDTDASQDAVGAVLSQIQDGQEKVIAYFSKVLSKEERNYCNTRREMLAVIQALKKFHPYVYGRPVTVRTDNSAVRFCKTMKDPVGQMARWIAYLDTYDLDIQHRAGRSHANADAMSRNPCAQCGRHQEGCNTSKVKTEKLKSGKTGRSPEPDIEQTFKKGTEVKRIAAITRKNGQDKEKSSVKKKKIHKKVQPSQSEPDWEYPQHVYQQAIQVGWTIPDLIKLQEDDPDVGLIMKALKSKKKPSWQEISAESFAVKCLWGQWNRLELRDGLLYRRPLQNEEGEDQIPQLVVPKVKRSEVLKALHDNPGGGHYGKEKTLSRVRGNYYWPGQKLEIQKYCKMCEACFVKSTVPKKNQGKMREYTVGAPGERVSIDILGPLPRTRRGNTLMLCIIDHFTKWMEVIPIPNQTANTVASAFVENWVCRYGAPMQLHSDQGTNFESKVFKRMCSLMGISKTRTTPLHPQSNGAVERANRTILDGLKAYAEKDDQRDWDRQIPYLMLAYRTAEHSSTGQTPSKVLFGRELPLPWHAVTPIPSWRKEFTNTGDEQEDYATYVEECSNRLERGFDQVRKVLKKTTKLRKTKYDCRATPMNLTVGQEVWLYNPQRQVGVCNKIKRLWTKGHFVVKVHSELVYEIENRKTRKRQTVHISRLFPVNQQL